jgi:hypothetical protein
MKSDAEILQFGISVGVVIAAIAYYRGTKWLGKDRFVSHRKDATPQYFSIECVNDAIHFLNCVTRTHN